MNKLSPELQGRYNAELMAIRTELDKPFVGVSYQGQMALLQRLVDTYPAEAQAMVDARRARENASRPPE